MSNRPHLRDMPDDELWTSANVISGPSAEFYRLAHAELQRRAAVRVADEVRKFNKCSTLLAVAMIGLTVVIGAMTAVQVYLAYCNT